MKDHKNLRTYYLRAVLNGRIPLEILPGVEFETALKVME
tara:strand:- start:3168 stop:3284 length:117 start_codon:yes stop_codon:yes gene_type:complete